MRSARLLVVLPFALAACEQAPESSTETPTAIDTLPTEPDGSIGTTPAQTTAPSGTPTTGDDAAAGTIPASIHGRWGMVAADCTSTRGDGKGLLTVTDSKLKFYESVGTVGTIKSRSDNAIRAEFAFTGEGMNWIRDVELAVSGDTLTRTERGEGPGGPFTYTRCAA